jgi:hypothetical protein
MQYHEPTRSLTNTVDEIERAAIYMKCAIRNIRLASKRPLTPYEVNGSLRKDDLAMKNVLDAASAIGIDFGVNWGNEMDVSDVG